MFDIGISEIAVTGERAFSYREGSFAVLKHWLKGCILTNSNIDISVGVGYNDITNNLQAHIICIRI